MDLNAILQYGPRKMRQRDKWTQRDSDTLAQFIDVTGCIARSSWRSTKLSYGISDPTHAELPGHESLVFVAVYFRQLFSADHLLKRAVNCHNRFSECNVRREWVRHAYDAAVETWNEVPFTFNVYIHAKKIDPASTFTPTLSVLFEALMYGAYVLHSIDKSEEKHAQACIKLLKTYPQNIILGAINTGLASVENIVRNLHHVIDQDFRLWFHESVLPKPNIWWKDQLFRVDASDEPMMKDADDEV